MKVFNLLLGGETAKHVNFMQHMLGTLIMLFFSSLEGKIAEVSKVSTSRN